MWRKIYLFVFMTNIFFISCDPSGNTYVANGVPEPITIIFRYKEGSENIQEEKVFLEANQELWIRIGDLGIWPWEWSYYKKIVDCAVLNETGTVLYEVSQERFVELMRPYSKTETLRFTFSETGLSID